MHQLSRERKRQLFWDIDYMRLDWEKNSRLIIERIFSGGTLDEMKLLKKVYGDEKIIHVLTGLNYLDAKTLNFVAILFKIPKREFRCYTKKQLQPQHWNS